MKRFSFPKSKRLVSNRQIKAVLARNLRVNNGLLTLFVAENNCTCRRLGISIGKSCGSAVVRNRLKRLLREVFRQSQDSIPAGWDYLLMVSPEWFKNPSLASAGTPEPKEAVKHLTFEQVKSSFLALVSKAVGKIR